MADETKKIPASGGDSPKPHTPDAAAKAQEQAPAQTPLQPSASTTYDAEAAPAQPGKKQAWQSRFRAHRAAIAVGIASLLIGGLAGFALAQGERGHGDGGRDEHGHGRHMEGRDGMRGGPGDRGMPGQPGQQGLPGQQGQPGQQAPDSAPIATPTPSPSASS